MIKDIHYAFRSLNRSRLVSAVAIATLGVGIGLNTSVFSIVNALLFRPLAVERSGELIWISSASLKPDGPQGHMTYPDVVDLRGAGVLAGAIAFARLPANVAAGGLAVRVSGQIVSGDFFDVFGVGAHRGRLLGRDDDRATAEPVAVISHALWQRLFSGRDDLTGSTIRVNGRTFVLAGVARAGFNGPDLFDPADIWVPLASATSVLPDLGRPLARSTWWLRSIGRLAPGVAIEEAEAALRARAAAIAQSFPESHEGFTVRIQRVRGAAPDARDQVRPISALLLGVTLTVLLIACANVANLLLVRGLARSRETAICTALGASRRRLIGQRLTESALLAAGGGALGLILSLWLTELLLRFIGAPFRTEVTLDGRVLVFTFAASALTAVIFGVVPALRSSMAGPAPALKSEQGWADARPRSRLQSALVAGQLGLSLLLLLGAGLFLESLTASRATDVGFEARDRVSMSLNLRMHGYSDARADAFHRELLRRIRATPGIRDASMATYVPMGGRVAVGNLTLPDRSAVPASPRERVSVNQVWPRFFDTLGIPVLQGRGLDERDIREVPTAAVINETMAHRYWPGQRPLGMRFSLDGSRGPFVEVVGVARDVFTDEFTERPWAAVYLPGRPKAEDVSLIVWAGTDAGQAIRTVEDRIRSLDSSIAIFRPMTLEQHLAERLDGERALTRILGLAGALALALAALGLYGTVAYTVVRRTREIGVRIALGAKPADVTLLFVRDAARLAALGLGFGIPLGIAMTAMVAGSLVGVSVADPEAIGGATAVLALVMLIASYIPARRAARIDPLVALRTD
jgi:predicted permease